MSVGVYGSTAPNVYNLPNTPNNFSAFSGSTQVYPLPQVGDLWVDPSINVLKKCTSNNPYIWVSVEGGGGSFGDAEVPTGAINGINVTYTLSSAPNPAASLILVQDRLTLQQGVGKDYTIAGNTITMASAPPTGASLLAWYRH